MPYNFVPTVFTQVLRLRRSERKSTILHQRGHFDPEFQAEGVAPNQLFLRS